MDCPCHQIGLWCCVVLYNRTKDWTYSHRYIYIFLLYTHVNANWLERLLKFRNTAYQKHCVAKNLLECECDFVCPGQGFYAGKFWPACLLISGTLCHGPTRPQSHHGLSSLGLLHLGSFGGSCLPSDVCVCEHVCLQLATQFNKLGVQRGFSLLPMT